MQKPLRTIILRILLVLAFAFISGTAVASTDCEQPVSPENSSRVKKPEKERSGPPLAAWELKRWGPIEVQVVINCEGQLTQINIKKEVPTKIEEKLKRNLARWRFRPAELDGEPVAVRFNLMLQDGPPKSLSR